MPKTPAIWSIRHRFFAGFVLVLVALSACGKPPAARVAGEGLELVATTGIVADAARRVLGDRGTVTALMGPGVDPHLYKASEGDVRRLGEADLILVNGLHLEGKMSDVLLRMARSRPVIAVTEEIDPAGLREPPEFAGQYDPHVWFDVSLWAQTAAPIAKALCELEPDECSGYEARAAAWREELLQLDQWVLEQAAQLAPEQRVLVTAHDAFGYFGRRYGFEVVGLQGLSTAGEAGLRDVERVADLVAAKKVRAVFVESSVPVRSIEAVQAAVRSRGHEVTIGGELFSDAMGLAGTPEGEYPGMVRHNVETILGALR